MGEAGKEYREFVQQKKLLEALRKDTGMQLNMVKQHTQQAGREGVQLQTQAVHHSQVSPTLPPEPPPTAAPPPVPVDETDWPAHESEQRQVDPSWPFKSPCLSDFGQHGCPVARYDTLHSHTLQDRSLTTPHY
jgi:hypothetical protein